MGHRWQGLLLEDQAVDQCRWCVENVGGCTCAAASLSLKTERITQIAITTCRNPITTMPNSVQNSLLRMPYTSTNPL